MVMPNQDIETHIGFQPSGSNGSEDTDHLVIKDLSPGPGPQTSEPLIQFKTSEPVMESDQKSDSEQPRFLNMDDLGLESPLELIGAQDCLEAQPIPALIKFDSEAKEPSKTSDSSNNPVFS